MKASLMHADEYGIRIDEVELDVPAITANNMNLDGGDPMVRR
jgi:hypothetical protein